MIIHRFAAIAVLTLAPTTLVAEQALGIFNTEQKFKAYASPDLVAFYPDTWEIDRAQIGEAILYLTRKKENAFVVVEKTKLDRPLAAADLTEVSVTIEQDFIKQRFASATSVKVALTTHPTLGRVVQADYIDGRDPRSPARVRQYLLPQNDYLYRIRCSRPDLDFDKQVRTFDLIVYSIRLLRPAEQP